eukprot:scaffold682_cov355-Prasinococcus_capsulatus_cf.AAC.9
MACLWGACLLQLDLPGVRSAMGRRRPHPERVLPLRSGRAGAHLRPRRGAAHGHYRLSLPRLRHALPRCVTAPRTLIQLRRRSGTRASGAMSPTFVGASPTVSLCC